MKVARETGQPHVTFLVRVLVTGGSVTVLVHTLFSVLVSVRVSVLVSVRVSVSVLVLILVLVSVSVLVLGGGQLEEVSIAQHFLAATRPP